MLCNCDFSGIILLTVGSSVPPLYYSNICSEQDFWRVFYLTFVLGMGCIALTVIMHPKYQGNQYKGFRSTVFAGVGAVPLLFFVHMYWYINPNHY